MTTRHSGYLVTLDQNYRDDDAEPILTALRMVKGVIDVRPVEQAGAFEPEILRVRLETAEKLIELAREMRR